MAGAWIRVGVNVKARHVLGSASKIFKRAVGFFRRVTRQIALQLLSSRAILCHTQRIGFKRIPVVQRLLGALDVAARWQPAISCGNSLGFGRSGLGNGLHGNEFKPFIGMNDHFE